MKVRRMRGPRAFLGEAPLGCLPEAAYQPVDDSNGTDDGDEEAADAQQTACRQHHALGKSDEHSGDLISDRRCCSGNGTGNGGGGGYPCDATASVGTKPTCSGDRSFFSRWLDVVEHELADIHGIHDANTRARHTGRSQGPKYVWECAAGRGLAEPRHSCAESRRWRNLAQHAHDMATGDDMVMRGDARPSTVVNTATRAAWKLAAIARDDLADDPITAHATYVLAAPDAEARR